MIRIVEVPTFASIPAYVPFGVLYYTQDTATIYIGTGSSVGANVTLISGSAPTPPPSPAWITPVQIHWAHTPLAGGTNNAPALPGADVISAYYFVLPFPFTFTKLAYQIDGPSVPGSTVILGMFDFQKNLVFDTGLNDCATVGMHSITSFWNGSALVSSVTLPAGGYYWSWAGEGDAGVAVKMPMFDIGDLNTSDSMVNIGGGITRWGHEGSARVSGGHFPATLGALQGGSLNQPMNSMLFA